ncbi:ATP-binding protein, partial [Paenibacillus antri]
MRIATVSIRNFRCLKEIENLPLQKFSIFIGENDSGKDAVIAIVFMFTDDFFDFDQKAFLPLLFGGRL